MDIFVTVVVRTLDKDRFGVYIPDLDIMQYGNDRVVAFGEALQLLRAINIYRISNGLEFKPVVTAQEAQKFCKSTKDFVTVAAISPI